MNTDELNKMLDKLNKLFEDGSDLFTAHDISKILEGLSPSHTKDLTTLTDVTFGSMMVFKYGLLDVDTAWSALLALALISFDIGKDAGE